MGQDPRIEVLRCTNGVSLGNADTRMVFKANTSVPNGEVALSWHRHGILVARAGMKVLVPFGNITSIMFAKEEPKPDPKKPGDDGKLPDLAL